MRGKGHEQRKQRRMIAAGALAAALTGAAFSGALGRGPASMTQPATATATATAPATTKMAPAVPADVILKGFPGNANTLVSRSDARNFSVEGRVREVRTVSLDPPVTGTASRPAGGGKTEVRVVLVGRAQADDVAAHFTCHMDKASEEAALKLKPDQLVRITGYIGTVVAAQERIDVMNCHELRETGTLTVGEQLTGTWRCTEVTLDGAALKKANLAKGIKSDNVPDGNYLAPWRLDLSFKADHTVTAELTDNTNQALKKTTGRSVLVKDGTDEARLRLDLAGAAGQETAATLAGGQLKLTLPGFADKFVLPEMRFTKLEGAAQTVDYWAMKGQTMQWFGANITAGNADNLAKVLSDTMDISANAHQGFLFTIGAGILRRGRTTAVIGAYGKLLMLEYSDAQTMANAGTRMNLASGQVHSWGTLMVPEVKIESLTLDSRNTIDITKPLTGKLTVRGLRKMPEAQYVVVAATAGGTLAVALEKAPGPDPQTQEVRFEPLPGLQGNPRLMLFFIGRQAKANDLFGDNANRVVSEPTVMLLDVLGR